MPLLLADIDTDQTIQLVKGSDETRAFVQRLGLVPGAKVRVVSAHEGDMIVMVKDVRVAITKEMAQRIMV